MTNLVTLDAAFTSEMNHFNVCNRLQPVSTGNSALKQKFCCSINPENHSGKTDIFYVWLYCFDRQLHYENFLSLVAIYFLGILGQLGKHFLLGCVHNKEYFNTKRLITSLEELKWPIVARNTIYVNAPLKTLY